MNVHVQCKILTYDTTFKKIKITNVQQIFAEMQNAWQCKNTTRNVVVTSNYIQDSVQLKSLAYSSYVTATEISSSYRYIIGNVTTSK